MIQEMREGDTTLYSKRKKKIILNIRGERQEMRTIKEESIEVEVEAEVEKERRKEIRARITTAEIEIGIEKRKGTEIGKEIEKGIETGKEIEIGIEIEKEEGVEAGKEDKLRLL
jgi:hypothetical protein